MNKYRIIVLIKQVPNFLDSVVNTITGGINRENIESIINPLDLFALEFALQIKDRYGAMVNVISMGPPKAEIALRQALAMGCDNAYLISGKEFIGSDTWATAYSLALSIMKISPFDLIVCGEKTLDGETGQVGPEVASFLDIPFGSSVTKLKNVGKDFLEYENITDYAIETHKSFFPLVLSITKGIGQPRSPTLTNILDAEKMTFETWGIEDINGKIEFVGKTGSPTKVLSVEEIIFKKEPKIINVQNENDMKLVIKEINKILREEGVIEI